MNSLRTRTPVKSVENPFSISVRFSRRLKAAQRAVLRAVGFDVPEPDSTGDAPFIDERDTVIEMPALVALPAAPTPTE